jgi:Domain of unknown function (DUF6438)
MNYKNSSGKNEVSITLKRESSDPGSPVYSLNLSGDGKLVYNGIRNTKTLGTKIVRIPKASVEELLHEFNNVYYFALKDEYGKSEESGEDSYVTTSLSMGGKSKKVIRHEGHPAPDPLKSLEDKIVKTSGSESWI